MTSDGGLTITGPSVLEEQDLRPEEDRGADRERREAARGGALLVSRFAAIAGLNYFFSVALAWLLPRAGFGDVGVLQAVLLVAGIVLNSAFPWGLVAFVSRAEAAHGSAAAAVRPVLRTATVANAALGAALAVAVLVVAGLSSFELPGAAVGPLLLAAFPVFGANAALRAALLSRRSFGALGSAQVLEVTGKVAVGIVLAAALGWGADAVILGFLVGALLSTAWLVWMLRDTLVGPGGYAPLRVFHAPTAVFLGVAALAALTTADVLMLQATGAVTVAAIGLYQAAVVLSRVPYYIADALTEANFPFVASRRDSVHESHAWVYLSLRRVALLVVPLALVLAAAPHLAIGVLFPARYGDAVPMMVLLAIASVGFAFSSVFGRGLQAVGRPRLYGWTMPVIVAGHLVLLVALVSRYGLVGAAAASTVSSLVAACALGGLYYGLHVGRIPSGREIARLLPGYLFLVVVGLAADQSPRVIGLMLLAGAMGLYGAVVLFPQRAAAAIRPFFSSPWATPLLAFAVAICTGAWRLRLSPDTQYDEVVYTRAAQQVVDVGSLTWSNEPIFVHPPLYFLTQAGWLRLTGASTADLFAAIPAARTLTVSMFAVVVALLVTLTGQVLGRTLGAWGRVAPLLVGLLAALDPVLLRYARLAVIEMMALALALLVLVLHRVVGAVGQRIFWTGVVGGLALLTKELTVVLLLVPLLDSVLRADRSRVRKSLIALAISGGMWLVFPLWAWQLGLGNRFTEVKTLTLQRLGGSLQVTGYNRPGISLISGLADSAAVYAASYLVLLAGAAVLVWLWLRRNSDGLTFLLAWLASSYVFAVYTVTRGTFNEQFFVFVVPSALVAVVVAAGRAWSAAGGRGRAWVRPAVAAALVGVVGVGATSWSAAYARDDNRALEQMASFVDAELPKCAAVNATGDTQKFIYTLRGRQVEQMASGVRAVNLGVHYFFLSPKDVRLRYGVMSPDLAQWLRQNGTRLASFSSHTYERISLYHVVSRPYDPDSGVTNVPEGAFVDLGRDGCTGYLVRDSPAAAMQAEWNELGGKGTIGRPLSRQYRDGSSVRQVFDGVVLGTTGRQGDVRPLPVVRKLASGDPDGWMSAGLPAIEDQAGPGLITDPVFAARWGDGDGSAGRTWGRPLSAPQVRGGQVRQAFARGVLTRTLGSDQVRALPIGRLYVQAGAVPDGARRATHVPALPRPAETVRPSQVAPLLADLAILVALLAVGLVVVGLRRRPTP